MSPIRVLLLPVTCVLGMALLTGCYKFQHVDYRFGVEFEKSPTAYRNGLGISPEPMVVAIKLQNLSNDRIRLARSQTEGSSAQPSGLYVDVTLLEPEDGKLAAGPEALRGLRAGRIIRGREDEAERLLFDKHAKAVEQLARGLSGELLHLSADQVDTALSAFANEAVLNVVLTPDWSKIPTTPLFVEQTVALSLKIRYVDGNGATWVLDKPVAQRFRTYLVNGYRGKSFMEPGASGTVSGRFEKQ